MRAILTVALIAAACAITIGPVDLTEANWESQVKGTNAFIKFYAPWCGHCKKLKPDWDQLGEKYSQNPMVLIGDVDCVAEKTFCTKHGIEAFPTLKWFEGGLGEGIKYTEKRSYEDLKQFVFDRLDRKCLIDMARTGCSEREKGYIDSWKLKMFQNDRPLAKELERLQSAMKTQEDATRLTKGRRWLIMRINLLEQMQVQLDKILNLKNDPELKLVQSDPGIVLRKAEAARASEQAAKPSGTFSAQKAEELNNDVRASLKESQSERGEKRQREMEANIARAAAKEAKEGAKTGQKIEWSERKKWRADKKKPASFNEAAREAMRTDSDVRKGVHAAAKKIADQKTAQRVAEAVLKGGKKHDEF